MKQSQVQDNIICLSSRHESCLKDEYLCDESGKVEKFDLMKDKVSKRYGPLELMATFKESKLLVRKCKNKENIDDLLELFFKERDLDCKCKYMILAFKHYPQWLLISLKYMLIITGQIVSA